MWNCGNHLCHLEWVLPTLLGEVEKSDHGYMVKLQLDFLMNFSNRIVILMRDTTLVGVQLPQARYGIGSKLNGFWLDLPSWIIITFMI